MLYGVVCHINDMTVKPQLDTKLSSVQKSGQYISVVKLSNNKILITHSYSSNTYLYGMLCDTTEIKGVSKTERSTDKIFGIAKTSGTENELIEVYTPNVGVVV